jgi:K+-sensing histidine kinase KdpD
MVDLVKELANSPYRRSLVRGAAALLPLVTCAVLASFRDDVTSATSALILVLWVVAAAASGDRVAGVVAALSGGIWFDFFLTEPYQRFTISDPDDVEVTVLLVVIGVVVNEIALWGRRQQSRAAGRSGYLDGVLSAARMVSEGDTPPSVLINVVARQITDVLGAETCRFEPGPVHDPRFALLDHDGEVTRGGHMVNVDRDGLPFDEEVAIVVRRGPDILGDFVVTSASHLTYPSKEQRRVAVLLADQVASVLPAV